MLVLTVSAWAQQSVFDTFEEMEGVSTVVVTKEAFVMLSKFNAGGTEGAEYLELVQNLHSLKVFTTERSEIAQQMEKAVARYLKTAKLTELMRVKDKEAHVKIYVRKGKDDNHVRELLMFVSNITPAMAKEQEAVILSLTGLIDLHKISAITEGYVPGSTQHLQKAGQ